MRIDKIISFLKEIYAIAVDDMSHRKFDLAGSISHGTLAYEKNGEAASVGANVLTYGDSLKITATATYPYALTSLKVNGTEIISGSTITVTDDINVVATTESLIVALETDKNYSGLYFDTTKVVDFSVFDFGSETDITLATFEATGHDSIELVVNKLGANSYNITCNNIIVYDTEWKNLTGGSMAFDDSYECIDLSEQTGWNGVWVGATPMPTEE